MKRIALILLSVLLIFALCACGEDKPGSTDKGNEKIDNAEGSTPMADLFDIPYQYDLSSYIALDKSGYTGIELTQMSDEVTEDDITEAVQSDLSNFAEDVDITDRGAEYGDDLNINFKGYESGVAFDGGTAENYEMVLGQAGFIDGFEEQLVGHKVGEEFTIDVVFPEDYSEPLAGKPAQFEIKINSIKGKNYPELTDEFVKENLSCETVEEYLAQKEKELSASKKAEVENARKSLAYSIVYDNAEIKGIPEDRLKIYTEQITSDITETAKMYEMDLETFVSESGMTMEDFNQYVDEQATSIVEQELVAYCIANTEKLLDSITKDDYNAYVEQLAASYGTDAETFEQNYPSDVIWNSLVLEKAILYVIANATTK